MTMSHVYCKKWIHREKRNHEGYMVEGGNFIVEGPIRYLWHIWELFNE